MNEKTAKAKQCNQSKSESLRTEPAIKNARLARDLADIKAMPPAERKAFAELCSL